ncbi:hypothetical protein [Kaarinaea lacus]
MNTDPTNPSELGAPFLQASVAAAMEYEVEVIFTGRAGELATTGVAENMRFTEESAKTVYDLMKDAIEAGAKLKICASNLDLWGDNYIEEISETVGAAYIISEAMDDETVTFTY